MYDLYGSASGVYKCRAERRPGRKPVPNLF